ncbi:MAG: tRNA preQ1(34) S-adenosylmethionine ribosyltransferase-isomerase QueA [Hyphomicrobiales bacterium]
MRVDEFDFDLPQECIALRPASPRDSARLLVVKQDELNGNHAISELPDYLNWGDVLVLNNTRVVPARLKGKRVGRGDTTPGIEATLHQRTGDETWKAFLKPARKVNEGDRIAFGDAISACEGSELAATVSANYEGGETELTFDLAGAVLDQAIATHGTMPLPPYIASKRAPDRADRDDYQTVYNSQEGAVAAPTAGLHFTDELLKKLNDNGIELIFVTLHVGAGTFLPVKVDDTSNHKMHGEWGEITEDAAHKINEARARGGKIIAAGTTSLRLLESAVDEEGIVHPFAAFTEIFITPGYRFRAVDLLLTNFHLPRSTLFMLVSAFSGLEQMKSAYSYAIENGFRFYSYGDACLLFPKPIEG